MNGDSASSLAKRLRCMWTVGDGGRSKVAGPGSRPRMRRPGREGLGQSFSASTSISWICGASANKSAACSMSAAATLPFRCA